MLTTVQGVLPRYHDYHIILEIIGPKSIKVLLFLFFISIVFNDFKLIKYILKMLIN